MININEYLLSKKNNKTSYIKYYVVRPDASLSWDFEVNGNLSKNETIHLNGYSAIKFWILAHKKALDMIKYIDPNDFKNRDTLHIWEVPEDYDIDEFKKDLIDAKINPWHDLKEIKSINELK